MDGKTKLYAIYAVLILIVIASFSIENTFIACIAGAALLFLGIVIETTKTKD